MWKHFTHAHKQENPQDDHVINCQQLEQAHSRLTVELFQDNTNHHFGESLIDQLWKALFVLGPMYRLPAVAQPVQARTLREGLVSAQSVRVGEVVATLQQLADLDGITVLIEPQHFVNHVSVLCEKHGQRNAFAQLAMLKGVRRLRVKVGTGLRITPNGPIARPLQGHARDCRKV